MVKNTYVPLMNMAINENNIDAYFRELKRVNVDKIFIAFERDPLFLKGEAQETYFSRLKKNVEAFTKNNFKVGVWLCCYGFSSIVPKEQMDVARNFVRLKSVTGEQYLDRDGICPEDKEFVDLYCEHIKKIAKLGVKMIMLDDDYCLSIRPGLDCFCDNHLKLLEQELGEKLEFSALKDLIFYGGENKYRDAYLKVMGETHVRFAEAVRRAVDSVDNSIRLGFCSGFTSWDIEGVDALELTKVLAGDTKPFLRFAGAPYWCAKPVNRFRGQTLAGVIEETRAQEAFCRDSGVETFIESDSYPRPRYVTPSSLIECFALAMRASGGAGELAYLMDYVSSPENETGYVDHRVYNKPLYEFIDIHFEDKACVGVKIFNEMHKFKKQDIPNNFTSYDILSSHFNKGAEFVAINGIPTCYEEEAECGAAFGEDAKYIKKFCKKMLIDIKAAKILSDYGYDLGLKKIEVCSAPSREIFGVEELFLTYGGCVDGYFKCQLKENTSVLSVFKEGGEEFPSAYTCSFNGVDFLVLCFDVNVVPYHAAVLRSYLRADQMRDFFGELPAVKKSTCLYQIFKKGQNGTAILFANLSENLIINGEISLDAKYTKMQICGVEGELLGDKIRLKNVVHPYEVFAVSLK